MSWEVGRLPPHLTALATRHVALTHGAPMPSALAIASAGGRIWCRIWCRIYSFNGNGFGLISAPQALQLCIRASIANLVSPHVREECKYEEEGHRYTLRPLAYVDASHDVNSVSDGRCLHQP